MTLKQLFFPFRKSHPIYSNTYIVNRKNFYNHYLSTTTPKTADQLAKETGVPKVSILGLLTALKTHSAGTPNIIIIEENGFKYYLKTRKRYPL